MKSKKYDYKKFNQLVKKRVKNPSSLSRVRKVLNKLPCSLTHIVLEERKNY